MDTRGAASRAGRTAETAAQDRQTTKPRRRAFALVAQIGLGALLALLIVRYSLVAYLATRAPELALRLDPNHPAALLTLAERTVADIAQAVRSGATNKPTRIEGFAAPRELLAEVGEYTQPSSTVIADRLSAEQILKLEESRDMAMRAMRADPLNYRAATLLGMITELSAPAHARDAPRPYYERAARLSPRASDAIFWLMRSNLEHKDYAHAVEQADTLLRTTSRAPPAVFPILARLLETPEAAEPLTQLLIADPPWRDRFMGELPYLVTDARTPLTLLLAMKQSGRQPGYGEFRSYLDFLVARQFHELAYYTWLQFLPQEQLASTGFLFNGSFETRPTGLPFDWSYRSGRGTVIDILPLPGQVGEHALRIDFTDGRVEFSGVSQMLLLAPGTYLLSGKYKGELAGKRGLRWRVSCVAPATRLVAETSMHLGPIPNWRDFELELAIPEKGCDAQRIHLDLDARSSSEFLVRGTMWYDDIRLARPRRESAAR